MQSAHDNTMSVSVLMQWHRRTLGKGVCKRGELTRSGAATVHVNSMAMGKSKLNAHAFRYVAAKVHASAMARRQRRAPCRASLQESDMRPNRKRLWLVGAGSRLEDTSRDAGQRAVTGQCDPTGTHSLLCPQRLPTGTAACATCRVPTCAQTSFGCCVHGISLECAHVPKHIGTYLLCIRKYAK
jgi:hypothetical protein